MGPKCPDTGLAARDIGVLSIRRIPFRRIPILGLGLVLELGLRLGSGLGFGDSGYGELKFGEMKRNRDISLGLKLIFVNGYL